MKKQSRTVARRRQSVSPSPRHLPLVDILIDTQAAQTQAQLDAGRTTPLDALDLAVLLIDGVHVGGHCIVVALGIDTTGAKHPLGLWEGATENAPVCQGLLTNLASRGLRPDRRLLVIIDGAQALATAVTQMFGRAAVVQRCQVHKGRNILEHLPEAQRP